MDFIALALFAIGIILVVAGYFLNHEKQRARDAMAVANEMVKRSENPTLQSVDQIGNSAAAPAQAAAQTPFQPPVQPPPPQPVMAQPKAAPAPPVEPQPQPGFQVEVLVQNENPKLFQKSAHLYLDSSKTNNYTGTEAVFKLQDVMGIRRFGQGIFSYDGFIFQFEHPGGVEKFALEHLDHLAFYPNCVVLVLKSDLPAALIFVDETDSIRRILETFKVDNAS